jgi:hypothetical protein
LSIFIVNSVRLVISEAGTIKFGFIINDFKLGNIPSGILMHFSSLGLKDKIISSVYLLKSSFIIFVFISFQFILGKDFLSANLKVGFSSLNDSFSFINSFIIFSNVFISFLKPNSFIRNDIILFLFSSFLKFIGILFLINNFW